MWERTPPPRRAEWKTYLSFDKPLTICSVQTSASLSSFLGPTVAICNSVLGLCIRSPPKCGYRYTPTMCASDSRFCKFVPMRGKLALATNAFRYGESRFRYRSLKACSFSAWYATIAASTFWLKDVKRVYRIQIQKVTAIHHSSAKLFFRSRAQARRCWERLRNHEAMLAFVTGNGIRRNIDRRL